MHMNTTQRRLMMRIKQLRAERGWSQEALGKKAGLARAYIARLEIGRHDPSLSTLVKLAKALKVTVGELVE
jgi:transcriptional regulator with XRE-family HTH domain